MLFGYVELGRTFMLLCSGNEKKKREKGTWLSYNTITLCFNSSLAYGRFITFYNQSSRVLICCRHIPKEKWKEFLVCHAIYAAL